MKFVSAIVFSGLAAKVSGFAHITHLNIASSPHTASSMSPQLQMVADDAKVILVTGASRGLGRAIAISLGQVGQKVVVNYAGREESALKTVEEIKAIGGDAIALQADCK